MCLLAKLFDLGLDLPVDYRYVVELLKLLFVGLAILFVGDND